MMWHSAQLSTGEPKCAICYVRRQQKKETTHLWKAAPIRSKGGAIPRCCFVLLRANGVQDQSLLTDGVFEQLGPIASEQGSLELCPCLLSWLPSLCCAAACNAFSCGSAAEESWRSTAVHSPNWTSKVRRREAEKQTQVPKQQVMKEISLLSMQYGCFFIPPALPSPGPCLARSPLVQRSEKSGPLLVCGNKRFPLL